MRKIVSAGKVIDEGKTRKAKVRFGKLDNFDVGVIRRTIHNFYRENIFPSLKKILLQLKEKMNFPYGKTHLWRLLKKMGFGYEKRGRQRKFNHLSSSNPLCANFAYVFLINYSIDFDQASVKSRSVYFV